MHNNSTGQIVCPEEEYSLSARQRWTHIPNKELRQSQQKMQKRWWTCNREEREMQLDEEPLEIRTELIEIEAMSTDGQIKTKKEEK